MKRRRTYPDLDTFFRKSGVSQATIADKIGVSQATISRYKSGLSQPSLRLALQLESETGVPLESLLRRDHVA